MSKASVDDRRLSRFRAAALSVVLVGVVAGIIWGVRGRAGQPVPVALAEGLRVSLAVEPFTLGDSMPADWNASRFADSLAAQLSLIRGILAASHPPDAHYVLRGHIARKDGRVVLATRLERDASRDTVWTATFWRSEASGITVLTDVAQAVAEAVFAESAKEPFEKKRGKP